MRSNFLGVSCSSGQQELLLGTVHCCTQSWAGAGLVLAPLCHSRNGLASLALSCRAEGRKKEKRKVIMLPADNQLS